MARAKRWEIPFMSMNGTSCRIDIYDEDWSGSVTVLSTANSSAPGVPTENPFFYEESSDDSLLEVIRYKTGYINLMELTYNGLVDLFPETDTEHYVEFYYGDTLDFTGYIQAQSFGNEFKALPRVISLPVISPLGLLSSMDFDTVSPPDLLYRADFFDEIITKLNAAYTGIIQPYATRSFRLHSYITCPPNLNPGELDGSDAYEPVTLAKFVETYCHMFGLIAHDTPLYIVFSQFDGDGDYTDDDGATHTAGNGSTLYAFDSYFSISDTDHKESLVRPLKEITVNYDGEYITSVQFDLKKTVFMKKDSSEYACGAFFKVVNTEVYSAQFLNSNMTGITNFLPTNYGVMLGSFGSPAQQVDGVLVYYTEAWGAPSSSTYKVVEFRFYDYPVTVEGETCILEISCLRAPNLNELPASTDTAPLSFSVDVDGEYYEITNFTWGSTQTIISGRDKLYLFNTPKGKCLTVTFYGSGFRDEELTLITKVSLTAGELEQWQHKYEDKNTRTIKQDNKSTETGSFSMLYSYEKLNSHAIFDAPDVVDYTPPAFGYMFKAQNRLDITAHRVPNTSSALTYMQAYIGKWTYFVLSWRWRMLAMSFYPRDDEYRITMLSSPSLSVFPVSTNFENVSSNAPGSADAGSSLVVTLTGVNGNKVQKNSVVVMMGTTDITSMAYDHDTKTVTISYVTGDISITAVGRPYDAEVEYLQGDGTAYIDTGIKNKYTVNIKADIRIESSSATIIDICGGRISTSSSQNVIVFYYANGFLYRYNTTTKYASGTTVLGDYTIETKTYSDSSKLNVSGAATATATITQSATFSNTFNYLLFNFSNNGTAQTAAGTGLKIKNCKMYRDSVLVRDYIAVRENGVGYLYDKVSGQLFGNANSSGSFTYGPDKNA